LPPAAAAAASAEPAAGGSGRGLVAGPCPYFFLSARTCESDEELLMKK